MVPTAVCNSRWTPTQRRFRSSSPSPTESHRLQQHYSARFALSLLALWLLAPTGVWAKDGVQAGPQDTTQSVPTALEVTEIAPGVYLRPGVQEVADAHNLGHIANLGFIVGDERVAVIDSGGSWAEGEALLAAVRAATNLPVAYLILTHMHPDHVLGSGVFADAGVEVVGRRRLPRLDRWR